MGDAEGTGNQSPRWLEQAPPKLGQKLLPSRHLGRISLNGAVTHLRYVELARLIKDHGDITTPTEQAYDVFRHDAFVLPAVVTEGMLGRTWRWVDDVSRVLDGLGAFTEETARYQP